MVVLVLVLVFCSYRQHGCTLFVFQDFQLLLSGGTTDVDMTRLRSVLSFTNSNGCSTDILDRFKR